MAATKHFLCGEVTDTSCMKTIIASSSFSFTITQYPHRIMHFLPSHLYFHKWILDMYTFDTFPLGILSPLYVREPFDTSCLKNWPLCQLWRGMRRGGCMCTLYLAQMWSLYCAVHMCIVCIMHCVHTTQMWSVTVNFPECAHRCTLNPPTT